MARIHRRTIQKDLHDPENDNGVITHLEPDILECEIKWAWGSITTNKASGGDGIPVELFQIEKYDALKVLHSICQHIWKTAVATGLEKVSFHSNRKEKKMKLLSCVWLFATPWTVVYQASLSMGFSRQEYWSGVPLPFECNCAVVWTFFGIGFLWDWNENWAFPVLWPLLSLPNLLAYWVQPFHSIIF